MVRVRMSVSRASVAVAGLCVALTACRGEDPKDAPTQPAPQEPPRVIVRHAPADPGHVRVHHGEQLQSLDLADVRSLDLALSAADQVGYFAELDPETTCNAVDLVKVAARAPKLTVLRVSGCPTAVHAGLGAFGERLQQLELADLAFDAVTVGGVRELTGLQALTLARVAETTDPVDSLRKLPVQHVALRDLDKDSALSRLLGLWPKTLRRVELDGEWAGHDAMLELADADALEILELRGTRVSNFSLNQIKGAEKLREVVFDSTRFNDKTPLYFKELPVTKFACDCERLGDGSLRSLRHVEGLRQLELRGTSVTGVGLEALEKLDDLETVIILDRDLGSEGFAALAELDGLRRLETSGPLEDPKLTGLSALVGLRTLSLGHPEIGNDAMPELAALTKLQTLDLGGTQVSDDGLATLAGLVDLRELYLDRTRITNRGLVHLATLSKLETLRLDRTDLVDDGLETLAGLPALKELRLDHTLVTDASIETLLTFANLERLSLAHTVITRGGVARLEALPKLDALDIEGLR